MQDKEKFLSDMQRNLDRYNRKLSHVTKGIENYSADKKDQLKSEIDQLKDKFQGAEKVYQDLKSASAENWETLKEKSSEVLKDLKEGFYEYADYLSLENLSNVKDEVMDYGQEKINDVSDYIKKKPFTSAAWALGIGFVLGKMLTKAK